MSGAGRRRGANRLLGPPRLHHPNLAQVPARGTNDSIILDALAYLNGLRLLAFCLRKVPRPRLEGQRSESNPHLALLLQVPICLRNFQGLTQSLCGALVIRQVA